MSEPERREARPHRSTSGMQIRTVYGPGDLEGFDPAERLGDPGRYPFTRGIHPDGYRARPWTMRQYAGFGSADETNRRFRYLLDRGQTGLSVAFDLPTQIGYDSDDPMALGEVGRVGVPIDSIEDMEILLDGIDLGEVSTSMTINATAAILLTLYETVARRRGTDPRRLRGTVQNDILKEYIARGTYIYPPEASMRLVTDTFAYCRAELPEWNTISISGYHMREAGSTAVQEVAFTVANAIAYADAAVAAGLAFDEFAPRLSFFFAAHNDLLEEVAKFRAARRVWARVARERFGASDPQGDGHALPRPDRGFDADRPAAGRQRRAHLGPGPGRDPRRRAIAAHQRIRRGARPADAGLRPPGAADPTSVEQRSPGSPRPWIRSAARTTWRRSPTRSRSGRWPRSRPSTSAGARSRHWPTATSRTAIGDAAYEQQVAVEAGERIIVGVNAYADEGEERGPEPQRIDPALEATQVERTRALRARRDQAAGRRGDRRAGARGRRHRERAASDSGLRRGVGDARRDRHTPCGGCGESIARDVGAADRADPSHRDRGAVHPGVAPALPRALRPGAGSGAVRVRVAASATLLPADRPRPGGADRARRAGRRGQRGRPIPRPARRGPASRLLRDRRPAGDARSCLAAAEAELVDREPRQGAHGTVAFVHPRTLNGVLWELLEPPSTE